MNHIISQLVAARKAQGLSMYALAERMGADRTTLRMWEAERVVPSLHNAQKWAEQLGLELQIKNPHPKGRGLKI